MKKIVLSIASALLLNQFAFAGDDELKSYVSIKYKTDYAKLKEEDKKKISEEYEKLTKVSTTLQKKQLKNDVELKVLTNIQAVELWASRFVKEYNPSQKELEDIYKSKKFTIAPRYNLRNILVKDEKSADTIIKSLNIADKQKKLDKFVSLVKEQSMDLQSRQKDGLIGWIDANKINPTILNTIKDKKIQDIVKVNVENIGWQVILIEDYQPQKVAQLDELKDVLTKMAKQNALNAEIEKLSKEKGSMW